MEYGCKHGIGGGTIYWHDFGHARVNQFIIEEIHEDLPVNSLLMDDGSLVRLPNFNRHYEVFDSFCSAGYPTCHTAETHKMVYKKLNDDSNLHIRWYGTIEASMWTYNYNEQSLKWYITINGQQCTDPGSLEIWHARKGQYYGIHFMFPKTSLILTIFNLS